MFINMGMMHDSFDPSCPGQFYRIDRPGTKIREQAYAIQREGPYWFRLSTAIACPRQRLQTLDDWSIVIEAAKQEKKAIGDVIKDLFSKNMRDLTWVGLNQFLVVETCLDTNHKTEYATAAVSAELEILQPSLGPDYSTAHFEFAVTSGRHPDSQSIKNIYEQFDYSKKSSVSELKTPITATYMRVQDLALIKGIRMTVCEKGIPLVCESTAPNGYGWKAFTVENDTEFSKAHFGVSKPFRSIRHMLNLQQLVSFAQKGTCDSVEQLDKKIALIQDAMKMLPPKQISNQGSQKRELLWQKLGINPALLPLNDRLYL